MSEGSHRNADVCSGMRRADLSSAVCKVYYHDGHTSRCLLKLRLRSVAPSGLKCRLAVDSDL